MLHWLAKRDVIVMIITFDIIEKILNFNYNPYIKNMTTMSLNQSNLLICCSWSNSQMSKKTSNSANIILDIFKN